MNFLNKTFLTFRTIKNWPLFLLDYAGWAHGDVLYKTKGGLQFIARTQSSDAAEIIVVASGVNYPLNLASIQKNPIVVDLGGYIGDFCIYAQRYLHKLHPRIYTYEPSTENYHYLILNIILNNAEKEIYSSQAGISSYNGTGYLAVNHKSVDEFQVVKNKTDNVPCHVVTLKKVFVNHRIRIIDILKIDIEGGELELLSHKETCGIINGKVRNLYIELHEEKGVNINFVLSKLKNFKLMYNKDHVLMLKNYKIN